MPKKSRPSKRDDLDVHSIRARSIDLVDAKGKTKATLFTLPGNQKHPSSTVFQMFGDDGTQKLELQVDGDSPGIRLTAANGNVGFSVAVNETSNGIMIGDRQGRPVVQIGIFHQGSEETPFGSKPAVLLSDFNDDSQSLDVAIKQCKIIQPRKNRK